MGDMQEAVRWENSVPIFKNTVILKQLGLAIGIPFGLVALVIVLVSGRSRDTLYALGFIAALLILTWLFVMAVYRGKYEAEFVLDKKGALCRTQARQAKKDRVINTLTALLGLLTGRPAVTGAGLLAQSKQEVFILWSRVQTVKYKPHSHTILLRGSSGEHIALFCTGDNYMQTERFVNERLLKKEARS
ncbi:MAG TPA: hypothetical protein DD735_05335 [Clostridiales bacterium]|jgi:hypothetical protein|nr:hypothetical protein [Clostridiales bacterium]